MLESDHLLSRQESFHLLARRTWCSSVSRRVRSTHLFPILKKGALTCAVLAVSSSMSVSLWVCCEIRSCGVEDTPFLCAYGASHLCWCLFSSQMTNSHIAVRLEIRTIVYLFPLACGTHAAQWTVSHFI